MLKNKALIIRGMKNDNSEHVMHIDYSKGERHSTNTGNAYTLLLDSSPHFSGWPKRSKSIICTNSVEYAENYVHDRNFLWVLVPKNGTKIAVCPKKDIWHTPVKSKYLTKLSKITNDVNNVYFRDDLADFEDLSGFFSGTFNINNQTTISQMIKNIDKELQKKKYKNKLSEYTGEKIVAQLYDDLTPKKCGFNLYTPSEFANIFKGSYSKFLHDEAHSNECWIGGPCLAIKLPIFEKIMDAYQKLNK